MRDSSIEWTEHTWNPMTGCTVISPGCTNCYAMRMARRLEGMGIAAYQGTTKQTKAGPVWTGKLGRAARRALRFPLTLRTPSLIFVNSMSDFFHEDMPPEWRDEPLEIMRGATQHTFQILTKRPEVAARWVATLSEPLPPNIWLGVSVETRKYAFRIGILADIPCHLRFISFEPLIGEVGRVDLRGISWAIIGGESGPKARHCDETWVRELVAQCRTANVAVFFKQWGTWASNPLSRGSPLWPHLDAKEAARLAAIDPHGKGGALLDGELYREMPT
jgi:protein gp37